MTDPTILHAVDGGVMRITLNRPAVLNSFDLAMGRQLQAALDRAANDRAVRAVLLTGAGRAFCAGQDLGSVSLDDPAALPDLGNVVRELWNPIVRQLRALEKPVVAAVNGVAAGAGANIALACDMVFVGKSASFIQAFSKIGLIPDSGGTFTLPRLVGFNMASALMITGDKVTSDEAIQYGMAYKQFADADLLSQALVNAQHVAAMPTKAIGLTKKLLNRTYSNTLEQQLEMERDVQVESANSYDYNEGVKAFLEKRKAEFKGE